MLMGGESPKRAFPDELRAKRRFAARWARLNNLFAHLAFALIVFGTVASAFLIGISIPAEYKWIPSLTALIPGIVVLINTTLKFEQRARWFYHRELMSETLLNALECEGEDEAAISRKWSAFILKEEGNWPPFGELPRAEVMRRPEDL
jgi:hypothetical protein